MGFEDLLAMADAQVRGRLGRSVTYAPGVGDAETVIGVFDAAYVRVEAGTAGISSKTPAVFLTISDLPSDPETDADARITVGATEYSIREAEPDGQGGVLCFLHETT